MVNVWTGIILAFAFCVLFFFFFFSRFVLGTIITIHVLCQYYSCTVAILFMHCSWVTTTLFRKNIKSESHNTIHTFKNYFTTVFSVFNFNKNKLYPNGLIANLLTLFDIRFKKKKKKKTIIILWVKDLNFEP